MIRLLAVLVLLFPLTAWGVDYEWPIRSVYDGDTIKIVMPGLPPELANMSVRADGVDPPSQCNREAR